MASHSAPASRSATTARATCRSSAHAFHSTGNISTLSNAVGAACSSTRMSSTRTVCPNCRQRTWALGDKFIRAISTDEIAPGGMKTVELDGREIVICNCGGTYYAIQRRCGHMNAPLELGTLDGKYRHLRHALRPVRRHHRPSPVRPGSSGPGQREPSAQSGRIHAARRRADGAHPHGIHQHL